MKLIVSRKHNSFNADQALDQTALAQAIAVGGQNVQMHYIEDDKVEEFINRKLVAGNVCHVFDYVESHKTETRVNIHKAA